MGNKKQQTIVIAVAAVLFLGGAYYLKTLIQRAGDAWPHVREPGSLTVEIDRLNQDIARLRQEIAKIPDAKEALEIVRTEHELASRVLPRESTPDQLLAAIRTKAAEAGVFPIRLIPSVGQGRGDMSSFEVWGFTLDLTGTYDQIATFINRMEEFESADPSRTGSEKRFFQVNTVTITAAHEGMGFLPDRLGELSLQHTCHLNMGTFRYISED